MKTYTRNKDDLEKIINGKSSFTRRAARALLFETFYVASADGERHPAEREAVYRMDRILEVAEAVVQRLEKAAYEDTVHRKHIIVVVCPAGLAMAAEDSTSDC